MAHWAEIDENSIVTRVLVTDNNDPNNDEGYQMLIDTFGGTWIKTSYNTIEGVHLLEGTPLRWTYAGPGYIYNEELDVFYAPSPHNGWVFNSLTKTWSAPTPKPDSGFWHWNDEIADWDEEDGR
jgi:hypothetical protein